MNKFKQLKIFVFLAIFIVFVLSIYKSSSTSNRATPVQAANGTILIALAGDWDDKFDGATRNTLQTAVNSQVDLL